jgi:hypothetical protein
MNPGKYCSWTTIWRTKMTRTILKLAAVAALLLPIAATADDDDETRGHKSRTFQVVQISNLPGGEPGNGAAWLKRGRNKVEGRIMTDAGMPGMPTTVWWLIWKAPGDCNHPIYNDDGSLRAMCNPGMGDAPSAVMYASSAISASDGSGGGIINAHTHLKSGEAAGGEMQPCCFGMLPKGMGKKAEIHMVVETHPGPLGDGFRGWPTELTVPNGNAIRGVPFLPVEMPRNDDDDD